MTNNQALTGQQRIDNPVRIIPKRLFSIKETAVYLGRSVWSVREMLWAGKIPFVKDGRRMLLDIRDMDDWIESSKIQMTS